MSAALLPDCCQAVVACYELAAAGDPRHGTRLYCGECTGRIALTVVMTDDGPRIVGATSEAA